MSTKQKKRDLILDKATEVIARYGLHKTTLEDIASSSGLKKASVYYYFESKEEIFAEVVRRECRSYLQKVREPVANANTAGEKFEAFIKTRYKHLLDLIVLHKVSKDIAKDLLPMAEEARAEFLDEELSIFGEIIALGAQSGEFEIDDVKLTARTLLTGMRGMDTIFFVMEHQDFDGQLEIAMCALQIMLYGLKTREVGQGRIRRTIP